MSPACFSPPLKVSVYNFDTSTQYIETMTVEIDFLQKKNADSNSYDTDKMANEFRQNFNSQAFCLGQQVKKSVRKELVLLDNNQPHGWRDAAEVLCTCHPEDNYSPLTACWSVYCSVKAFWFCFSSQFVFKFCEKVFLLVIKVMDAMDPSILKGEQSSNKTNKVSLSCTPPHRWEILLSSL